MSKTRNTDRKQIIQALLADAAGTPIVLEELRWRVMCKELEDENGPVTTMTVSYQKSFNRTLRVFLPDIVPGLRTHRILSGWTAGLLAHVAVYRLGHLALVDRFLACSSAALHFWTNAKTIDIWEEGGDGEVEVRSEELLPENAPDRLDSLYPGGSLWPRSSPERKQALNQLGPKYLKRPLVCIKLCTRDVASPEKSDVLAIIRMPTNQPLSVIADATLAIDQVQQVGPVPWKLYQRRRGVTRTIPAKKCVVA